MEQENQLIQSKYRRKENKVQYNTRKHLSAHSQCPRKHAFYYCLASTFYCMLTAFVFSGCKTVYVPVESVKTQYVDRIKRDSIHVYDSIYIRQKPGIQIDTLEITRWHTEYRDRLKVDSVFIRDSIAVPYPVEKPLTKWQSMKMDIGGLAIGGCLVLVITLIFTIIRRRRL